MHKLVTYFSLDIYILNKDIFINAPRGKCDSGIDFIAVRAVLMGTKSCTKILILPKIFPTRFRFTFYG